jgi:hypothetical protein
VVLLSCALADETSIAALHSSGAFRKASKKMMLSYSALSSALEKLVLPGSALRNSGLTLNTGFGEIEATGGFLKAVSESGVARPFLFQNSLHNSTTGFLAIQFGIQGPVFTVNHRTHGGHQALEIASTLLEEGLCEFCFVVSSETVPPEFAGKAGVGAEGAAALILSTAATSDKYSLKPIADQKKIDVPLSKVSKFEVPLEGLRSLLEFDPVFRLAQTLISGRGE